MTRRGVFVGRFQPPHLGHLETIQYILKQVDEIIIIVAAAQISHTRKNPLTAGERLNLLRVMLKNASIPAEKYWLIPAEDIMDNALWVHHLKRLVPPFDSFFGNNPFVRMLFEEAGIGVNSTPMFDREKYEATTIRNKIIAGDDIKQLIDAEVLDYLQSIQFQARLESIIKDDSTSLRSTEPGSELKELADKQ